jgi:hypothetical protein
MTCVAELHAAIDHAKTSWPGVGKPAVNSHVLQLATELAQARDRLAEKLEAQDGWLTAHPDHPKTKQRTDQWIRNLRNYEQISDVLADIAGFLVKDAA